VRHGYLFALAWLCASPGLSQSPLPSSVTDGMYITLAEVRANAARMFDLIAGSDGGPIPKSEFVSVKLPKDILPDTADQTLLAKLFEQLDADGDDRLTRQEWERRINRDLSFADSNGDGRVSMKELANARQNMSLGDALGMVF
jgi:Ca2+-binding EF-hand superfamily protein